MEVPERSRQAQVRGGVEAGAAADRRSLDERLEGARRFEAAARFAGAAAHELNNMLTVILGTSDRMLRKSDERSRREAEIIHKAAEQVSTLTRALLAFSRRRIPAAKAVDLSAHVRDLERVLVRLAGDVMGGKPIALECRVAPSPALADVDPGRLTELIVNLVLRSCEAVPPGGTLTIETADVVIEEAREGGRAPAVPPGRYVMLAVGGTGSGLGGEALARALDPLSFVAEKAGAPAGSGGPEAGRAVLEGAAMSWGDSRGGGEVRVVSESGARGAVRIYFTPSAAAKDGRASPGGPIG